MLVAETTHTVIAAVRHRLSWHLNVVTVTAAHCFGPLAAPWRGTVPFLYMKNEVKHVFTDFHDSSDLPHTICAQFDITCHYFNTPGIHYSSSTTARFDFDTTFYDRITIYFSSFSLNGLLKTEMFLLCFRITINRAVYCLPRKKYSPDTKVLSEDILAFSFRTMSSI